MHLRSKVVSALGVALMLVALMPTSAYAYVRIGHKLKYGVGDYGASNQHYYITSSASSYASSIDSAMHDWIYTTSRLGITTPISYTKTSTQTSSRMDIYAGSTQPNNRYVIAETQFFVGSSKVDPRSVDWVYGKILINSPVFNTLSASERKGSCAHEMGHVMGLDENNANTRSVMCQLGAGRSVTNAQSDDCRGINAIY